MCCISDAIAAGTWRGACKNSGGSTGCARTAWNSRSGRLYEPDPAQAWERLRGIGQLAPEPRARAKAIAVWREKLARERDLPRAWILSDAALFSIAQANPTTAAALDAVQPMNEKLCGDAARCARALPPPATCRMWRRCQDARPTPEQKALLDRLSKVVDARAAELQVSAEVLAPRGELKALAMGRRDTHALTGWRLQEIGARLLAAHRRNGGAEKRDNPRQSAERSA